MSAGATGAVGPVSVRYAAQIRELLFAQAMQRMAAEQEAARASNDEASKPKDAQPIDAKVDAPKAAERPTPAKGPESKPDMTTGQLVDIQA
jgi:hypothetical protein